MALLSELRSQAPSVDDEIGSRDELQKIWHQLEEELSPNGLALFRALLVDEQPLEEVSETFAVSANALYTFRSRVRRRIQGIRERLAEVMPERRLSVEAPQPSQAAARMPPSARGLRRGR